MKSVNLISYYQGILAIKDILNKDNAYLKGLKAHEIRNLANFCDVMLKQGCQMKDFDGFFVAYEISQIGKEFDLLRFSEKNVLNIELKSELKTADKQQKILKQMRENFYYLNLLGKPITIITFVEHDGFYHYNSDSDNFEKVTVEFVASVIMEQIVDRNINPDKLFIPSNYLVSPFNSTDRFLKGEYFLTNAQQNIKVEISNELSENQFMFFCISANAGTGKTLLTYDIAKEKMKEGKKVLIVHCGKLNDGHYSLMSKHGWKILSIRNIPNEPSYISRYGDFDYIFVDEAQRIRDAQLTSLTEFSKKNNIPMFFSFDTKQYLRSGETKDIAEFLSEKYPDIKTSIKKLTTKIRTNKAMASFITNLMEMGKSKDNLNYECVTIEYFNNKDDVLKYIEFLKTEGWQAITYTVSRIDAESYDKLIEVSDKNAHDVIGQEFPKVVFVMDDNFHYENNKLLMKNSYYSAKGMLYQIVTRVVNELKIIVLDNPALFAKLLEIKQMETRKVDYE